MRLGNTVHRETHISVDANKSYAFGVRVLSADETPLDLSSVVLRFVATTSPSRTGTEVLTLTASPVDGVLDVQLFEFQASDLALDPRTYYYDVTMVSLYGYSTPLLKGELEVGPNADDDISNVYTTISNPGPDVTVTLDERAVVNVTVERVDGILSTLFWTGTQAEYDALQKKNSKKLYLIVEPGE